MAGGTGQGHSPEYRRSGCSEAPIPVEKTVTLAILKGITDLKTEGNILPSLNLLDLQLSQNKDRRGDDGGENQDDEGHEEGLRKD